MPESSKVWSESSLGVSGPEVRAAFPHIFLVSDTLTPPNTGLITWGNGLTSPVFLSRFSPLPQGPYSGTFLKQPGAMYCLQLACELQGLP